MLMSDGDLKSYTDTAYHNEELKSLTRYRFDKVRERDNAVKIRDAARQSIGSVDARKVPGVRHTIALIHGLDTEIEEIKAEIQTVMESIQSPITTIPDTGLRMGAMILTEIGNFSRFDSPDKILAYAGLSPSTYRFGQPSMNRAYSYMEKRGSRYLRYTIPLLPASQKNRLRARTTTWPISHAAKKRYVSYSRWRSLAEHSQMLLNFAAHILFQSAAKRSLWYGFLLPSDQSSIFTRSGLDF